LIPLTKSLLIGAAFKFKNIFRNHQSQSDEYSKNGSGINSSMSNSSKCTHDQNESDNFQNKVSFGLVGLLD